MILLEISDRLFPFSKVDKDSSSQSKTAKKQ